MSFNWRINSKRDMYVTNFKYIKMYNNNISSIDDLSLFYYILKE